MEILNTTLQLLYNYATITIITVPARYIEKQKKGEPVIGAFFFIVFLHPLRKPRAVDTITVYMYIFVPQRSG